MWKVMMRDGRVISADYVECEGGALVLSRLDAAEVNEPFLIVPPGTWIGAEKTDANSNG